MKNEVMIPLILFTIVIMSICGCTSQGPDSMLVDVHLVISGDNISVVPEHQVVEINKSTIKNVSFSISTTGINNISLLAWSINVDGIANISAPPFIDNSIKNETGNVVDYQKIVQMNVTILTNATLPDDMQSVYIYYG